MDTIADAQRWFSEHVTLDGKPYTLDQDQARAAIDYHKNTLVTARAGSGKTRVIVAKVAYLAAKQHIPLEQIAVFMFNRTAAAEVNERISKIQVDGCSLVDFSRPSGDTAEVKRRDPAKAGKATLHIASTFHKYALDIVKAAGERPQIITEAEHDKLIQQSLDSALKAHKSKLNSSEKRELLSIVSGFIARAGQKYPGHDGLTELHQAVRRFLETSTDPKLRFYHQISYRAYAAYLMQVEPPVTDFNLLMHRATAILEQAAASPQAEARNSFRHIRNLKYLMIDEYQDFSYLFFALTTAIRQLAPTAKLFAVGDDWQAINRFAGSDVDYFLNFCNFFPEDSTNIPLATNYRSARKIVAHANRYMLKNYDSQALPAKAFSHQNGKIKYRNPTKLRFDETDVKEDCLGDGRFQAALAQAAKVPSTKIPTSAARLLKQIYKIVKHHRHADIMLLHRHNFTTFEYISLETLHLALQNLLVQEHIMSEDTVARQIRCLTMHKSKGLEAQVVILLEVDREVVASYHPHATIFQLFGDTRVAESADQKRLLYVAMTRAKEHLYILSSDSKPLIQSPQNLYQKLPFHGKM